MIWFNTDKTVQYFYNNVTGITWKRIFNVSSGCHGEWKKMIINLRK